MTMEGNIVVNGVLASCYAHYDHDVAHFALTPVYWFPGIVEALLNADNTTPEYLKAIEEVSSLFVEVLSKTMSV